MCKYASTIECIVKPHYVSIDEQYLHQSYLHLYSHLMHIVMSLVVFLHCYSSFLIHHLM